MSFILLFVINTAKVHKRLEIIKNYQTSSHMLLLQSRSSDPLQVKLILKTYFLWSMSLLPLLQLPNPSKYSYSECNSSEADMPLVC